MQYCMEQAQPARLDGGNDAGEVKRESRWDATGCRLSDRRLGRVHRRLVWLTRYSTVRYGTVREYLAGSPRVCFCVSATRWEGEVEWVQIQPEDAGPGDRGLFRPRGSRSTNGSQCCCAVVYCG